jgi:hypothetical protein
MIPCSHVPIGSKRLRIYHASFSHPSPTPQSSMVGSMLESLILGLDKIVMENEALNVGRWVHLRLVDTEVAV